MSITMRFRRDRPRTLYLPSLHSINSTRSTNSNISSNTSKGMGSMVHRLKEDPNIHRLSGSNRK